MAILLGFYLAPPSSALPPAMPHRVASPLHHKLRCSLRLRLAAQRAEPVLQRGSRLIQLPVQLVVWLIAALGGGIRLHLPGDLDPGGERAQVGNQSHGQGGKEGIAIAGAY